MSVRLEPAAIAEAVGRALDEDLGVGGDVTTETIVPETRRARATLLARAPLVLAGLPVARAVFLAVDPSLAWRELVDEGARLDAERPIATIEGRAGALLVAERTALNFLMRLSGIATASRAAVDEVAGTGARILDTRKTAPGLRRLDKYAVAVGGATNHRLGLHDAAMIKDTHLDAGITIGDAVHRLRGAGLSPDRITVEVRDLRQLDEAIAAGAGRALLDNMDLAGMRAAVERAGGRIELEASGSMRPGRLRPVAETGVDWISIGWLTHSAPAADLSMRTGASR